MNLRLDSVQGQIEKLSRLPRSQRIGVVVGLLVVILGGYGYFLFRPAQKQLASLQQREQKLQREVSELKAVATNLERFKDELTELEGALTRAVRKLPDGKQLPVLLTDISSLGKDAGLEFKAFRPRDEVPQGFYAEVPIEIEFNGRFHDIATFFDKLAKLSRIVNVDRLDVRIKGEGAEDTRLEVKGQATTFRFLGRTQADAASEPAGRPAPGAKRSGRRT